MEVVDLGQGGEGDGVAAVLDAVRLLQLHLALLHVPPALLHLGEGPCGETTVKTRTRPHGHGPTGSEPLSVKDDRNYLLKREGTWQRF